MERLPTPSRNDPALAALALWCDTTDSDADITRTSGETIHVGETFERLPLQEQIGVLGHHILHIALRHEGRMQAMQTRLGGHFDPLGYNLCADAVVNTCILEAGHALPRPCVTLPDLVANLLPEEEATATDLLALWDVDKLYLRLSRDGEDGRARQQDFRRSRAFIADLDPDAPGQPDAAWPDDWSGHLTRAQTLGAGAGRGIGRLLAQLTVAPVRTTPWEVHLRRMLTKALSDTPRRTFRRPRAAWIAADAHARETGGPQPVFEPGFDRQGRRARIAVGLDSSASISDQILSIFAAEVLGIARRTGAEVHVLSFDEVVYAHDVLRAADFENPSATWQVRRAGGTSFIDVLAKADALDPSAIVLLTDLDGPIGRAPKRPLIWACCTAPHFTPPFGQILDLTA